MSLCPPSPWLPWHGIHAPPLARGWELANLWPRFENWIPKVCPPQVIGLVLAGSVETLNWNQELPLPPGMRGRQIACTLAGLRPTKRNSGMSKTNIQDKTQFSFVGGIDWRAYYFFREHWNKLGWMGRAGQVAFGDHLMPSGVAFEDWGIRGNWGTLLEVNLGHLVLPVVGWSCSLVAEVLFPRGLVMRFDSYDLYFPLPFSSEPS